ncbi:MAG TPA: GFA family protein [Rhizobiaceae bacterium]|nr:GFA family protein [Rhizobiaceae bacterium]
MLYRGGCHCGNIAIETDGDLTIAVSCNCSICSKKGALLWAVPHGTLKVTAKQQPGAYLFHNRSMAHRFCTGCGIHVFAEDVAESDGRSAYINIRCLEAVDIKALEVLEFDGRSAS